MHHITHTETYLGFLKKNTGHSRLQSQLHLLTVALILRDEGGLQLGYRATQVQGNSGTGHCRIELGPMLLAPWKVSLPGHPVT